MVTQGSVEDTTGVEMGSSRGRVGPLAWVVVGMLLGAAAVFLLDSQDAEVEHLTGTAQVGQRVASIESNGTFYGVSESVAWIDASGSDNEDGWPTCLGEAGNVVSVRFGAVTGELPDGSSYRSVVYVDCRTG